MIASAANLIVIEVARIPARKGVEVPLADQERPEIRFDARRRARSWFDIETVDEDGQPVPGVRLRLKDADGVSAS
jgi:hypothetical protein